MVNEELELELVGDLKVDMKEESSVCDQINIKGKRGRPVGTKNKPKKKVTKPLKDELLENDRRMDNPRNEQGFLNDIVERENDIGKADAWIFTGTPQLFAYEKQTDGSLNIIVIESGIFNFLCRHYESKPERVIIGNLVNGQKAHSKAEDFRIIYGINASEENVTPEALRNTTIQLKNRKGKMKHIWLLLSGESKGYKEAFEKENNGTMKCFAMVIDRKGYGHFRMEIWE